MVRRSSRSPSGPALSGAALSVSGPGLSAGGLGEQGGSGQGGSGPGGSGSGVVLDDEVRGFVRALSVSLARGDLSLADDIEQETLLVALQRRPESPGALRAWLRSIARFSQRSVLGRGRRHGNHVYYDASIHDGVAMGSGVGSGQGAVARAARLNPAELGARQEAEVALDRALDRLPVRYGRVVRMRVLEGMPPRAIAAELDVPVNTVRTWTRRAFEQLREDADCITMERAERSRFGAFGAALLRFARSRALWIAAVPAAVIAALFLIQSPDVPQGSLAASAPAPAAADPGAVEMELAASSPGRSEAQWGTGAPLQVALADDQAPAHGASEPVLVTVLDEADRPVAGAEIYVHAGLNGDVLMEGLTGADGTVEVWTSGGPARVAARGAAGRLSESVLLGQPYVTESSSVSLRLREVPVQWIDVDRSARPDLTGALRLEGIPEDPRMLAQESPLGGIRGVSCWVPAWEDQAGRFGVTTGDLRKYIAVWAAGEPVAIAGPVTIAGGAPGRIALRPTWAVAGRLVTADGQPVAGAPLRLGTGFQGGARVAASRGLGGGTVTNGRGEFRVVGLVGDSVTLGARGLSPRTIERPDAESVDVGTIAIDQHVQEIGLAGRITGASGPFTVQAVTSDWRRSGVSIHMLRTRGPEDCVATNGRGEFELRLGASSVRSILVTSHAQGDQIAPTWAAKPDGGWGALKLDIRVDPLAAAHVTGELSRALSPRWIQFVHVDSGYRLEGVFGEGRFRFASPPLGAGRWRVEAFDRRGMLCRLAEVDVQAGAKLELGKLAPETGELDTDWPQSLMPREEVHLTVFKDGALWFQRRVWPSELQRDYSRLRLSAGSYGFEVRGRGTLWGGECEVRRGESALMTMEPHRRVRRAAGSR